ncbi:MAG: hypothetical protein DHS20C10_02870 [marine bacterium B5-7]|nr:MAG: hypothetical protein DHS20C10_02870 [marine bacterium B5-7]
MRRQSVWMWAVCLSLSLTACHRHESVASPLAPVAKQAKRMSAADIKQSQQQAERAKPQTHPLTKVSKLWVEGNMRILVQEGGSKSEIVALNPNTKKSKDVHLKLHNGILLLDRHLKTPMRTFVLRTNALRSIKVKRGAQVIFLSDHKRPLGIKMRDGGTVQFQRGAKIKHLTVEGSGHSKVFGPVPESMGLNIKKIAYQAGKGSRLVVNYIKGVDLNVVAGGAGDVSLYGLVANLTANLRDKVTLNAKALPVGRAYITAVDKSTANVWPLASLQARAYGAAQIAYFHRPKHLTRYAERSGAILDETTTVG